MRVNGRWIYIKNHTMENINEMYEWNHDLELIEIECGNKNRISDIDIFRKEAMESYIQNNHENNSTFCHFGIHRKSDGKIIGYTDLINIEKNYENAELCIAIPNKKLRNKVYGMDSIITILYFAFNVKGLKNVSFSTRIDNYVILNICKKMGFEYSKKHFCENGYSIDLVCYTINKELFDKIVNGIFKKYIGNISIEEDVHPGMIS